MFSKKVFNNFKTKSLVDFKKMNGIVPKKATFPIKFSPSYTSLARIDKNNTKFNEEYLYRKLVDKNFDMKNISFEDISFEHQQAILKIIFRFERKTALNPQVAEFMKEKMYNLHISNPDVFTFKKLAHIFAIPRQRVRAIVLFKIEEHQRRREGLWLGGPQIEQLLEETFGVLISGKQEIPQKAYVRPSAYDMVSEDVQLYEYHKETYRRRAGPRREIPAEPPSKYEALKKSYLLKPREDRPMRKYKCYVVDISGRFSDYNRPIIVSDFDRSVRTANWDERRAIIRKWRPKEIKLTKGSVPTNTFIDTDRIFDFDNPRVNRAFYYPDYSGPYIKMPLDTEEDLVDDTPEPEANL
eukprot:TRINITY_DN10298_c0_g1_i1.p1 TRINITY_DN10298_c0_g1~~TRINITY_DN10298_c0_g1_i1.p1  ORF type:complete len:354 (+),score=111.20 TRINITY_DN10298_c0_g1_i1:54-1115(+)